MRISIKNCIYSEIRKMFLGKCLKYIITSTRHYVIILRRQHVITSLRHHVNILEATSRNNAPHHHHRHDGSDGLCLEARRLRSRSQAQGATLHDVASKTHLIASISSIDCFKHVLNLHGSATPADPQNMEKYKEI